MPAVLSVTTIFWVSNEENPKISVCNLKCKNVFCIGHSVSQYKVFYLKNLSHTCILNFEKILHLNKPLCDANC